jgi:hypothetical protein
MPPRDRRSCATAARSLVAYALFTAAGGLSCSSWSSGAASGAKGSGSCDPLAAPATSLGFLLAAGQDSSGTYYVVDEAPGASIPDRVFISDGKVLVRQHLAGSGSSGGPPDADYTFSFEAPFDDAASTTALVVQMRSGAITGMALGPGDSRSFFGPDAGQTPLTVVDPMLVMNFNVVNLPNVVQYLASVSNGDAIVITSPMDLATSADFRLFYGPPAQMAEYPITAYNVAHSGIGDIAFAVGSTTYTLHLTIVTGGDAGLLGTLGPGSLDTGSGTFTATFQSPTPTTLTGYSFTCSAGG